MEQNYKVKKMYTKLSDKKLPFIYSNNDIFESVRERVTGGNNGCTVFVPHVCNNIDLFGAGFAAQVAEKYPSVKADYHMLGKNFLKNNFGYSQILKVFEDPKHKHQLYFVNMIAQNGTKNPKNLRPLNYFALAKSMQTLSNHIQNNTGYKNGLEKIEIHCPKFGSGLAGGNWDFITNLIEDIWSSKFFVTVYNYNPKRNR
jgi:hypothetical protein